MKKQNKNKQDQSYFPPSNTSGMTDPVHSNGHGDGDDSEDDQDIQHNDQPFDFSRVSDAESSDEEDGNGGNDGEWQVHGSFTGAPLDDTDDLDIRGNGGGQHYQFLGVNEDDEDEEVGANPRSTATAAAEPLTLTVDSRLKMSEGLQLSLSLWVPDGQGGEWLRLSFAGLFRAS